MKAINKILGIFILGMFLISFASAGVIVRLGDLNSQNKNTVHVNKTVNNFGDSFNATYDTWLPNYTAYSKFWYNMSGGSSGGSYNASYVPYQNATQPLYLGNNQFRTNGDILLEGNGSVKQISQYAYNTSSLSSFITWNTQGVDISAIFLGRTKFALGHYVAGDYWTLSYESGNFNIKDANNASALLNIFNPMVSTKNITASKFIGNGSYLTEVNADRIDGLHATDLVQNASVLSGTGNEYACLDSTGKLFRSAVACV